MDTLPVDERAEIASDGYLDNVVWASLSGAHSPRAQAYGGALRYRPEFAPFGAARDYSESSVAQIAAMLRPGERLSLFTIAAPEIPQGYDTVIEATLVQMIASRPLAPSADGRIVPLANEDAADMLRLAEIAQPGPFNTRTHELGNFIGIREQGRLVAMAGERMVAGKYVEISAVCTHPDRRGVGYGRLLMEHLTASIQQRGQAPLLHVFPTNEGAIKLYRALGYRTARKLRLTVLALAPL